jgi:glutathione reductase (NADPH)
VPGLLAASVSGSAPLAGRRAKLLETIALVIARQSIAHENDLHFAVSATQTCRRTILHQALPMNHDFDLFVIGGGSGGVRAARMAATFGARVAIAERHRFGGTCVNVGCVPKKLLVYAAQYAGTFADARGFGWDTGEPRFDWRHLIDNKDREIARLNGSYEKLLADSGVEIVHDHAVLDGPHAVVAGNRRCTAGHILVATGGWPVVPEIPGREHAVTSNEAFFLERLPRRIAIVGGGYIAAEFAGIFNGLGAETTLLYRGPLFLRGFDREMREFLAGEMRASGVQLRFDTEVRSIARGAAGLTLHMNDGKSHDADLVMVATGRKPVTAGLGLESAGVKLDRDGAVVVNERNESSTPSVLAIGDVTNRINLTPVATAEGGALARRLFGGQPDAAVDYAGVPSCIFSQPNFAMVGLTEEQARERHGEVLAYRTAFTPLRHTLSGRRERTLMKLVVERAGDRVVGAHMVGPDAGEIIQGIGIAIKTGATKRQFDSTIGIHPTAAEEFVTLRQAG